MAGLIFIKNPLARDELEHVTLEDGARPIDWLTAHHPRGFGVPVHHWHNGERIELEHPDYLWRPARAGDCVVLAVMPAEPITVSVIVTAILTAVIGAAISVGLSLLFANPRGTEESQPGANEASQVYSVRSRQNSARLGEPIPVLYGTVLTSPDTAAQPYSRFIDDRGMYTDVLLCLGHGEFDVHEILVGESESSAIENAAVQYIVVPPFDHQSQYGQLGPISTAAGWSPVFLENVWSSIEVGEQRLSDTGDSAGYFRVGRAGRQTGRILSVNVEWPAGLYGMSDASTWTTTSVDIIFDIVEADADGNPIAGTEQTFTTVQTGGPDYNPRRETYTYDAGYHAAWLCRLRRTAPGSPAAFRTSNEYYWRALSLVVTRSAALPTYGDVTLIMVRLKAEEVTRAAERLVRVRCTRRLGHLGDGAPMRRRISQAGAWRVTEDGTPRVTQDSQAATADPSDAFADILCNQVYGARRPLAELDLERLEAYRAYWAGAYSFNAVYTQRTSVWEALAQSVQGVAAVPLPIGGAMSLAQDGPRPVRSMMFTEQNIVQKTFTLRYEFEEPGASDGVEIEYVDPDNWAPAYARYPTASNAPDRQNLFGCSDPVQAAQYARLQWQRRQKLRRVVEFATELEGLIPLPAERIAVAHTLPRWGVSGYVVAVAGLVVTLDRGMPWADVAGPHYMMFRDEHSGASALVAVTQGAASNIAVLAADPWTAGGGWIIGEQQEGTQFAWGDGTRAVKDFTLTALSPKGGVVVGVTGVIYDPSVYDSTLAFLANPVP